LKTTRQNKSDETNLTEWTSLAQQTHVFSFNEFGYVMNGSYELLNFQDWRILMETKYMILKRSVSGSATILLATTVITIWDT